MKAPLGLMPAAVRCQPYPFAGITQVRFLRSPRPVGASQPGLPPALEGGERPELPLSYSLQGKGSTGGRGRQSRTQGRDGAGVNQTSTGSGE